MTVSTIPSASVNVAIDLQAIPSEVVEDSMLMAIAWFQTQASLELTLEGHVIRASQPFLDLMGYSEEEIAGVSRNTFCTPETLADPDFEDFWSRVLAGQEQTHVRTMVRKDGTKLFMNAVYVPVRNRHGEVYKVHKLVSDVSGTSVRAIEDMAKLQAIDGMQPVIEFTAEGIITRANQRFLDVLGYASQEELLGKHHRELCFEEFTSGESYGTFWTELLDGQPHEGEVERRHKNGSPVWLHCTYTPIADVEGRIIKVVKFGIDITATKLKGIADDAKLVAIDRTQAVIEFDVHGNILSANDIFLKVSAYRLRDLQGKHHRILCPAGVADKKSYAEFWAQLANAVSQSGEYLMLNKNSVHVWMQATYTPVLGLDGKVAKVVCFATDVTPIKERQLEDEGKLAAIYRSQGVIEFDLSGSVLSANDNFLQLMNYKLEEVVGEHHRMFVDNLEVGGGAYRAFWQKLGRGEFHSGEYLRFGKDGKRVWIQATYNPILDLEGNPVKVVKFCTDITESKLQALENQAQMQAVFRSSCVWEMDRNGVVLSANDLTLKALGLAEADMVGKPEVDFMFNDEIDHQARKERWNDLREGKTASGEMRRKNSSGNQIWFAGTLSPLMGLDGACPKSSEWGRILQCKSSHRLIT